VQNSDGEPWERLVTEASAEIVIDANMLDQQFANGFEAGLR
jgi:hypothetical protein